MIILSEPDLDDKINFFLETKAKLSLNVCLILCLYPAQPFKDNYFLVARFELVSGKIVDKLSFEILIN
jgi:hypothetical protein